METNIETIIFIILLIDALMANLLAWGGAKTWWNRNFRIISRYFPLTRGWTTYYLVLVLIMGIMLIRLDALMLSL